jgi:XTP/dITP diphosphohydrolase
MTEADTARGPLLTIVVASNNLGKIVELQTMLSDLPVQWLRISDLLRRPWSVVEDGTTFEENAVLKARAACRATGFVALADDSGLEVDALAGRPGIRSARFAHEKATDEENNEELLRALRHVQDPKRAAQFRCVLALLARHDSVPILAGGCCKGRIAREPFGHNGFGYDPLFRVDRLAGRSMADLSADEKNQVSHRGDAVRQLRPLLIDLLTTLVQQLQPTTIRQRHIE